MIKILGRKILTSIALVAIIAQSFSPYVAALPKAYAQEDPQVTETPAPTDTPAPTVDQTPTDQTATPTPTVDQTQPTDTVTPTPTDVPTDTLTPTPTDDQATVTPAPTDNNSPPAEQSNTNNDNNSNNQSTPASFVSPTVTPTPQAPTGNEEISMTILKDISAPSIDLGQIVAQGSASLTTDKLDYAPTDTVLLTGSNLLPNTTYTLQISSSDEPPIGVSAQVTSDENGKTAYAYQLDGNYRPNYKAELRDESGAVVATTTFTDSNPSSVTYCHATPPATAANGWNTDTSDGESILNAGHDGHGANIIPSFQYCPSSNSAYTSNNSSKPCSKKISGNWKYTDYLNYAGKNINHDFGEGITGQTILNNGCKLVANGILTVKKHVVGTGSASSWTMHVKNSSNVEVASFLGSDGGTNANLTSGNYTVTETGPTGYTLGYTGCNSSGVVTVTSNQTVICTLTNTQNQPDLTVTKTNNVNDNTLVNAAFNWILTITNSGNTTASFTSSQIILQDNLPSSNATYGTPTDAEAGGTSTNVSCSINSNNLTCKSSNSSSVTIPAGGTITVTVPVTPTAAGNLINPKSGAGNKCQVDPSGNVAESDETNNTCSNTVTVTQPTGQIIISKDVVPNDSGVGHFNFTIAGPTNNSTTLVDGQTSGGFISNIGSYTITETGGTSASLSNYKTTYTCSVITRTSTTEKTHGTGTIATFTLNANENVTCAFTNTRHATITVYKFTTPSNNLTSFPVSITGNGQVIGSNTGSVTTSTPVTFVVTPGTYHVAETLPSGWTQDVNGNGCANVTVGSESGVWDGACNIFNSKLGSIKIVKDADPRTENHFDFSTSENLSPHNFSLEGENGENTRTFSSLNGGRYSVTEQAEPGWVLTGITCNAENYTTDGRTVYIPLSTSQDIICTFHNVKYGSIEGVKWNDLNGDGTKDHKDWVCHPWWAFWNCGWEGTEEPTVSGWTITLQKYNSDGGLNPDVLTATTDSEDYDFNNVLPGTYNVCEVQQGGWIQTYPNHGNENLCQDVTVGAGQDVDHVNFGNQRNLGKIIVYKHINPEGMTEGNLSGWTFTLSNGQTATTNNDGIAEFDNVNQGSYTVTETSSKPGWGLESINCSQPNLKLTSLDTIQTEENPKPEGNNVYVTWGQTATCNATNKYLTPKLTISKSNDAGGTKYPGDTVGFTITISNDQNAGNANNVTVTDLLPNGFHYNSGSWSAGSNLHGVLSLSEPTYHSPGVWTIGTLATGETVTLKYTVTIDGSQADGTYYDEAWGQGFSETNTQVQALAVNPGFLDTNFVGTQVAVANSNQASSGYNSVTTQSVLGASIGPELPSTGENTIWVIMATLLAISGFGSLAFGLRLRRKNVE